MPLTPKPRVTIYTNYTITTVVVKQTKLSIISTDKLNLRLVRASIYLLQFNLDVRYKLGKLYVIPDALSRLPIKETTLEIPSTFYITLVEISNDFKTRLKEGYTKNKYQRKILNILTTDGIEDNPQGLRFRLRGDLVYFVNKEDGKERLYILKAL